MNGERIIFKERLKPRLTTLMVFFLLCFCVLSVRLFVLQVLKNEEYAIKARDNIRSETPLRAERGIIYDRNMVKLATNVTNWRIYLSPRDIKDEEEAALISRGLSEILGVPYDTIYKGALNNKTRDRTVKKKANDEEKDRVLAFVLENKLSHAIHTEADTARYYPYEHLASQVIGFMGTDSGLIGLESYYNSYLSGMDGIYITSKNASGERMPSSYDTYIPAQDGNSLITTIDVTLQSLLETQLKNTFFDSKAQNKVTGIVMEPSTGAILAMATYPSYDLNNPYVLDPYSQEILDRGGLVSGTDEYKAAYNEKLYQMWNNKAVSTLYEPGSTFKVFTTSVALELGVSKLTEGFFCKGSLKVEGYGSPIKCHKRVGHGSLNFIEALQKSCNPTMMTLAARIGNARFMDYFIKFGYTGKTGIDLPGEALGIFHKPEDFKTVELAVYSFGQTFKTTPLQQLSAVCAVANGGYLVTPYVVNQILDAGGGIVYSHKTPQKGQVISSETSAIISDILEGGVSGMGGAKNAGVEGYKIAAKTGTSQVRDIRDEHGNSYLYVSSCVAYAPSDNPQIAIIIIVDQPQSQIYYGSTVAAPYISGFLRQALPYLGIEPVYNEEQEAKRNVSVDNYTGKTLSQAKKEIGASGLKFEVIGDGENVVSQIPVAGSKVVKESAKVILYTDGSVSETVKIPDVQGMNATDAIKILLNSGFNIQIAGVSDYSRGVGATVIAQSQKGIDAQRGEVIVITLRYLDGTE